MSWKVRCCVKTVVSSSIEPSLKVKVFCGDLIAMDHLGAFSIGNDLAVPVKAVQESRDRLPDTSGQAVGSRGGAAGWRRSRMWNVGRNAGQDQSRKRRTDQFGRIGQGDFSFDVCLVGDERR